MAKGLFTQGVCLMTDGRTKIGDLKAAMQQAAKVRREREQQDYVEELCRAVLAFLDFDQRHLELAARKAELVTEHATPVGSGTVARTERIPLPDRAAAAAIAWMRHQTTGYDRMVIPRAKGERREVRRRLATRSKELLARYRAGADIPDNCPLRTALRDPE